MSKDQDDVASYNVIGSRDLDVGVKNMVVQDNVRLGRLSTKGTEEVNSNWLIKWSLVNHSLSYLIQWSRRYSWIYAMFFGDVESSLSQVLDAQTLNFQFACIICHLAEP